MIITDNIGIKIISIIISIIILLFNIADLCKFIPGVVPNLEDVLDLEELENIQTGDIEGEMFFSSEELKEKTSQINLHPPL